MARTEDLVARRGGPAVFLGRWIGFPRAVVPAAAGAVGMRGTVLLAWNAVGGGLWATVVVAGFCAGASWPAVQRRFGTGALIAGVGAVVLVVVVVLLRRRARTTSRRLDPGEPRSARRRPDRALLGGLGLGMILAVAFGELSDNVADHTPSPPKTGRPCPGRRRTAAPSPRPALT